MGVEKKQSGHKLVIVDTLLTTFLNKSLVQYFSVIVVFASKSPPSVLQRKVQGPSPLMPEPRPSPLKSQAIRGLVSDL